MPTLVLSDRGRVGPRDLDRQPLAGAESAFVELARALASRGHEVFVRNRGSEVAIDELGGGSLDWGPLGWICLVPLILLVRLEARPRWMYTAVYVCGFACLAALLQWMRLGDPTMYFPSDDYINHPDHRAAADPVPPHPPHAPGSRPVQYAHVPAAFAPEHFTAEGLDDDDRQLAMTTLTEGDATVTMLAWAFEHLTQEELLEIGTGTELPDTTGIPSWMVNQLQFPYSAGQLWIGTLARDPLTPDFAAVDAIYDDPPVSTEQVIHLDKWEAREAPIPVEAPDLAGILGGREGYPIRYSYRVFRTLEDQPVSYIPLSEDANDARYPDTHVLDLRIAKSFRLEPTDLTLSVDCFNALNSGYVLLRANVLGTGTGSWVTETLGPRTFRVGARLSLR